MIATTRLFVASASQSISFPSNGSIASAMFGLFHGSRNSGDWARVGSAEHRNTRINIGSFRFIFVVEIVADGKPILRRPCFKSKRQRRAMQKPGAAPQVAYERRFVSAEGA